jgi:hypothetical protein
MSKVRERDKQTDLQALKKALQKIQEGRDLLEEVSYPLDKDWLLEVQDITQVLLALQEMVQSDLQVEEDGHKIIGGILADLMFCDPLHFLFLDHWAKAVDGWLNNTKNDYPEIDRAFNEKFQAVFQHFRNQLKDLMAEREKEYGEAYDKED